VLKVKKIIIRKNFILKDQRKKSKRCAIDIEEISTTLKNPAAQPRCTGTTVKTDLPGVAFDIFKIVPPVTHTTPIIVDRLFYVVDIFSETGF
jgi:hypothetical protein